MTNKMTTKYVRALEILGDNYDKRQPNIVAYGRLAEMGYEWDGKQWELLKKRYEVELEIRITSYNPDDVMDAADCLAAQYHEHGHKVHARPPVLRDSGVWQAYIRISE